MLSYFFQEPAGIFDLIEVVGNGTYGQVYKVSVEYDLLQLCWAAKTLESLDNTTCTYYPSGHQVCFRCEELLLLPPKCQIVNSSYQLLCLLYVQNAGLMGPG